MKSHVFGFALLIAAAVIASAPAQAQNGSLTRSFVSSAGVDTNPCTITQPCATFAHAYTAIGANGIIAALDPGKYGPLTITGPVTINGNGWAAITAPAQGAGITINAVSGNVTLTGIEIDGAEAAYQGIVFNTGSGLTISNCIVKDFVENVGDLTTGRGIWIAPTTGTINFAITNTAATNNAVAGISYFPHIGNATVIGVIDHVIATDNFNGIAVDSMSNAGSAAVSISNSIASNNTNIGVGVTFGTGTIDNSQISNNDIGVEVVSTVLLGRSTITKNSDYGIQNSGTINSFQNNQVYENGNGNAVGGTALNPITTQ
jgi:hypothetical protein